MEARRRAGLAARVLLALLSVGVLAAAGSGWVLQQQLRTDTVTSDALTPGSTPIPEGEPFTALLVGLDARTDAAGNPLPPQLLDALHAGADEGQLHTDTMILLRVPGRSGGPATAISIPRDSYVPIVGERGKHKINSAYRRGVDEAEQALGRAGRHRRGAGSTVPRGRSAEAHRVGGEPDRHHDRPLRGDQPGRVRRADRRPRRRLGLPQHGRARLLLGDRPAGRAAVGERGRRRWPSSASGTGWTAATWTASAASRPSRPGWPSACRTAARCPTPPG